MATAPGPVSLAASARRSLRRAIRATVAPRLPSPTARQRPSPLDAPTTTVLMDPVLLSWVPPWLDSLLVTLTSEDEHREALPAPHRREPGLLSAVPVGGPRGKALQQFVECDSYPS